MEIGKGNNIQGYSQMPMLPWLRSLIIMIIRDSPSLGRHTLDSVGSMKCHAAQQNYTAYSYKSLSLGDKDRSVNSDRSCQLDNSDPFLQCPILPPVTQQIWNVDPMLYYGWANPPSFVIERESFYSAGIDFRRQKLTSVDVSFWHLMSIPALKE